MLHLAAREADTLALGLPPRSTEDDLEAKANQVRAIAGGTVRPDSNSISTSPWSATYYPPQAAAWLGADPQDLIRHGSITVLVGSALADGGPLLRRRDRAAVSYVSVNAQFADRFAPVIELLADA